MRGALGAVALMMAIGCRERTPDQIFDEATALAKQAQQDRDARSYDRAHQLYEEFLGRVPTGPMAEAAVFFDAELQLAQKRHAEAARGFQRYLVMAPRGGHVPEAAYGDVVATQNALGLEGAAPE